MDDLEKSGLSIIQNIENWNPKIIKLATLVSLAVRIEPELLRSIRINLAPELDASAEADLWFSLLVEYRNPRFIILKQSVLRHLRDRLKSDSVQLYKAREIIGKMHQAISPALLLEENVLWIILAENGEDKKIDSELYKAVAAFKYKERRENLAFWVSKLLQRLPAEVLKTKSAQILRWMSSSYDTDLAPITSFVSKIIFNKGLSDYLPEIEIGIHREDNKLILNTDKDYSDYLINVPDTNPIVLEITNIQTQNKELVSLLKNSRKLKKMDNGKIEIRTAADKRYLVPAFRKYVKSIKVIFISSNKLVEDIKEFGMFFYRKNEEYIDRGILFESTFLDSASITEDTGRIYEEITQCDVLFMMVHHTDVRNCEKVLNTAIRWHKKTNKPLMHIYIKRLSSDGKDFETENTISVESFKERLGKLGFGWTDCSRIRDMTSDLEDLSRGLVQPVHIFISSAYIDSHGYRKALDNAREMLEIKYEGLEYVEDTYRETGITSFNLIEKCDLFIGIYATRYGNMPEDSDVSTMEQEYHYAKKLNIPCMFYLINEEPPLKMQLVGDKQSKEKLQKFKNRIAKENESYNITLPERLYYHFTRNMDIWITANRPEIKNDISQLYDKLLEVYFESILKICGEIPIAGTKHRLKINEYYIPLTMHEIYDAGLGAAKSPALLNAEDLLKSQERAVLVTGEPGSGKTTILNYLAYNLAYSECRKSNPCMPIYAKLKEFNANYDALDFFLLISVTKVVANPVLQDIVQNIVNNQQALILLDGLDEVNPEEFNPVLSKIQAFVETHLNCRVIITARKSEIQNKKIPFRIFEINSLTMDMVNTYVSKWPVKNMKFMQFITEKPWIYEMVRNPYLLSITLLIFEKENNMTHMDTFKLINDLTFRFSETEKYKSALEISEKVLMIFKSLLGENNPETVWITDYLSIQNSMKLKKTMKLSQKEIIELKKLNEIIDELKEAEIKNGLEKIRILSNKVKIIDPGDLDKA